MQKNGFVWAEMCNQFLVEEKTAKLQKYKSNFICQKK